MLDLEGLVLTTDETRLLADSRVGGIILFSRNYASVEQLQALVAAIREIRPELLIAVDQEGGRVQRFKDGFTRLPAMQQFLPIFRRNAERTQQLVQDCGWLMASELLAVGIDFSFAPVLDLDTSHCTVIADRSFSAKPKEATALAACWIAGMKEAGMAATGKHFPGHGGVSGDSHLELPIDTRSYKNIHEHDLIPFRELSRDLQGIMPAHILFPEVDKHYPVGFSQYWLQQVLRKGLGFEGVIFSDDLTMEGAANAGSFPKRAVAALTAGCDMLLVCNNRKGVLDILESGVLPENDCESQLSIMRGRPVFSREALLESERWQRTSQFISMVFRQL